MAPEHPDVLRLAAGTEHEEAVRDYVNRGADASPREERGGHRAQEDRRAARAAPSSTRSTASGSRCTSPTTC